MDIKQMSNRELMKAGTQEAATELKERSDRVRAAMEVIKKHKEETGA